MGDNNLEGLRGLFEGGNFNNAQINVINGDGIHVSYEAPKAKEEKEVPNGLRQSVIDYVNRLMPVVTAKYREDYSKIWLDILEEEAVSSVIYDPGKQQGTVFNRNLVAQISRMMAIDGIIVKETKDVAMAELLEPQRGKHHPVRKQLAFIPDDNKIKKAVKEVFKKHGVEVP